MAAVSMKSECSLVFLLEPYVRSTRTSHVGKLLASTFHVVAVFGLDGILDGTGHGVIDTQDGTLH